MQALHGDLAPEPVQPMLQMDGIRIATLILLGVHTVSVIVLAVFLINNVQAQREVNECYQRQVTALTSWAAAAVDAGRSDRQAQRELLLAEVGQVNDGREAVRQYLGRLDEADRTRTTAPVPAQRCAQ
jgi:hypothetical protein